MPNSKTLDLLSKFDLALNQQNWNNLLALLNCKQFLSGTEEFVEPDILAKVCEILTSYKNSDIPDNIIIACLKCLGASAYSGYKHKPYDEPNLSDSEYYHKLYSFLTCYPRNSHFPYERVAHWSTSYIIQYYSSNELSGSQKDILRLCIQFLCNLFTFACKDIDYPNQHNIPKCIDDIRLKEAVLILMHNTYEPFTKATCIFVHNALKGLDENYFSEQQKRSLCSQLLKPIKEGYGSAKDALLFLLSTINFWRECFENMSTKDRLDFLEIIYQEIVTDASSASECKEQNIVSSLTTDIIEFFSKRFCKISDLILKTSDTCLTERDTIEVTVLLDMLGDLTSRDSNECISLKNDKSLLINCAYLLKSIHMIGRESSNYFTPLQKLSDVAPAAQGLTIDHHLKTTTSNAEISKHENQKIEKLGDFPYNHLAFGFKAALIRVVGNMSYKNKECQDLLREIDAIPLLLDCCNIDARNPLIMQWTILALRNLCDGNLKNQEVIRNSTKVGVVESSVLEEMGLTLHEEDCGKKIGIVPLVRNEKT